MGNTCSCIHDYEKKGDINLNPDNINTISKSESIHYV